MGISAVKHGKTVSIFCYFKPFLLYKSTLLSFQRTYLAKKFFHVYGRKIFYEFISATLVENTFSLQMNSKTIQEVEQQDFVDISHCDVKSFCL